ncbi:MAG: glycoside hydrolase family 2 TIM barrel-domain containing protein [Bacteroidota bacterium]
MKVPVSVLFLACFLVSFTIPRHVDNDDKDMTIPNIPVKTEIKKEGNNFQLYVDGKPFYIKGAGLEYGDVEKLAEHGGNSFKTWTTNNGRETGMQVLDRAYKNGLYVTMGLAVTGERHGFDYNDPVKVAEQFERIKKEVLEHKDHPALIIWAIGNELNLHSSNPKVWDAVNQISEFIHEVDPNHLTTTTIAGVNEDVVNEIKQRVPDIDLLSVQMYADIVNLPRYIKEIGWDKAYMVTEWGATGHWEVGLTPWSAPIENHSSTKADFYLERYNAAIGPYKNQCIGSYVFLWGQKQERTPTWYGMFLESGEKTESVDVMHYLWNGNWPENRCPRIEDFRLDGKTAHDRVYLKKGQFYTAEVKINDPDGDNITYIWDIKPESTDLGVGGDYEKTPRSVAGLLSRAKENTISIKPPKKPGAYRLFVYAYDGNGNAAHANIPFYIKDKKY